MQINGLIRELIGRINSYEIEGEEFEALFAFNETVSPVPIKKTYIAFAPEAVSVDFFESDNSECCKRTIVTLSASFYCSPKRRAEEIYALAETVMDNLMTEYAGRMHDYRAEELKIDDNLRLIELPVSMSFTFEQCPAFSAGGDTILPFAEFLCKTHVNDDERHLTSEEKAFVGRPFVTGSYTGDGETTKTIELGFSPKFVIAARAGAAPFGFSGDDKRAYLAFAVAGRAQQGLSITDGGFSVSSSAEAYSVKTALNDLAVRYFYLAG